MATLGEDMVEEVNVDKVDWGKWVGIYTKWRDDDVS